MKIVHLPNGYWCIEAPDGTQSPKYRYEAMGYWIDSGNLYVGQTEYFGHEALIIAREPMFVEHKSVDRTLG